LDSEGAISWTSPSSSASSSFASPNSCELGKTCTSTLPGSFFSASSLNFSAALPFGVPSATTWLNLITIGWATAVPAKAISADATIAQPRR
jgi:hypothetical protein